MQSIDERVVAMAFENQVFESRVAQTMTTLGKLDTAIKNIGSVNGLDNIEKAANKVTLQQPMSALDKLKARFSRAGGDAAEGMNEIERAGNKVTLEQPIRALNKVQSETAQVGAQAADGFNQIEKASGRVGLDGLNSALDSVTAKFSTLQAAAAVALGGVARQAAAKGASFAKSFSFGPIQQGFDEYQTNLGSIQTIMANTEGQRISGLNETNKHLAQLNTYSDQTIYNFSQMAKNIGTFTAAGVDLDTATNAIKGISNLAALSGSSAEQASVAMYQLSQAISSGKVGLQDWNSVVNAGMGGRKFQNSLIQTGVAMGTIDKAAVKIDKSTGKATINGESFRESIMSKPGQKSWLTSEVLTGSLEQFTGDLTDAQLKAKGFTDEQIKSIQATAKSARAAATEVKTLPQAFDVAKETIGSGWAKTFQLIFGDFKESKKTFTEFSNTLNGFINNAANARNKVLGEWSKLGGRDVLIKGIKQAFQDLIAILKPVHEAFRDIFPPKTGKELFDTTKGFADLMKRLKPSVEVVDGLRRTFRGLFAILHIGWSIVKGVVGVIGDLLGIVGKGSGGFLNFTGSIGDFLVAIDNALTKGGLLKGFFHGLETILKLPVSLLGSLASALGGLFGHVDASSGGKVAGSLNTVKGAATPLASALDSLKQSWDGFVHLLGQARDLVSPWLDTIGQQLSKIGDVIAQAFQGANFDHIMTALQTGFVGGIFLVLKKAISGGAASITSPLKALSGVLGGVTGNLQAMQQKIKAQTIFEIAAAIGVLAGAVLILSKIDPKKLASAMSAIAIGLGELMGAMKLMTGGLGKAGIIEMPIIAGSMVILAGSMVILAAAVKIFSTMSWEELAKGLVGVGGGLAAIALGMKAMGPGSIIQAPALLVLAVALNAIALAVKQFAGLSWEEIAKGLAGVLGSLVAMIAPITEAGPMLTIAAPGIIGIAFALNMLAGAVFAFGKMDVKTLATGLIGATLALAGIGVAMNAIPPHAALLGAGLLVVAVGLGGIAAAVKAFGSMSIGEIAKGLVSMGLALSILAVGLSAMSGTLLGAAALMAAAAALAILAPTLGFLGTLNWGTIFKGLAAIALTLGTLSILGLVASEGLVALGIALLPLGLAFVTVGAAAYLFAIALSKLATDGTKGIAVMVAAITAFVAILPKIIIDFVKGLVEIVGQVAILAPKVVDALAHILDALISVVIKETPRLAQAIGVLVQQILIVVVRDSPKLIQAGITLLLNLLKGIDQNIGKVVSRVANIVTKFIDTLTSKAPALTAAGARAIIAFLGGFAKHLGDVIRVGQNIVIAFLKALIELPGKMIGVAVHGIISFISALGNRVPKLVTAAVNMAGKFLHGLSSGMVRITRVAANALIDFLNGFAKAIRDKAPELRHAGWNIVSAMVDGMLDGFKELWHKVTEKAQELAKHIPAPIRKALDILSPSRVMMGIGKMVVLGLAVGMEDNTGRVTAASMGLASATKAGVFAGLANLSSIFNAGISKPLAEMVKKNHDAKDLGEFLGASFREGLTGGLVDKNAGKSQAVVQIEDTFKSLGDKLGEEQQKLRDRVKDDRSKLNDLLGEEHPNVKKIQQAYRALFEDTALLTSVTSSSGALMKSLEGQKNQLVSLSNEYDMVTKQLEKAQEIFNTYQKQYDVLPDFNKLVDDAVAEAAMTSSERWEAIRKEQADKDARHRIDQVALYKESLKKQIEATTKYMETLAKLRDAGLDDQTYQKLLEQGTAGQEFASQLLSSGKGGIDQINKLDSQLAEAASSLADNAAKQLYKAGEEAAIGLVKALQDRQAEIRGVMDNIAKSMIDSIKSQLGIKSPSRVFAEIGRFAARGLANGLSASSNLVRDASEGIGNDAADALTKSLANISDRIQNDIDTDITITPVLDLTQVQKDASKIQDLSNVVPITAAASYGQAAAISQETQATATAQADSGAQKIIEVNLEQNNTSPKALDDVEIYRQTRNQLSQVKSALGLAR